MVLMQACAKLPFVFTWQMSLGTLFTYCLWVHNQNLVKFSTWFHLNINYQSGHNLTFLITNQLFWHTQNPYLSYKGKLTFCKICVLILTKWMRGFLCWCISTASADLRFINFVKSKGNIILQNVNKMLMAYVIFSGECLEWQVLTPFEM